MKRLSCENEFCIYQKQGRCLLESVQLDIQGNCVSCIYINIEKDVLDKLKKDKKVYRDKRPRLFSKDTKV